MLKKLMVIDGNSIVNRAFYGIMGNKMLQTADGTYTNAIYGFLAIMFKELEDVNPDYLAIAFDLKAPTARHKMYEGYKATRKGMPEELASQMPILKELLKKMNIDIIEMEGYEADDILGTLSRIAEERNMEAILLTGDRDSFQLATDNVKIHLPRTKAGRTETEMFDRNKVLEVYGVEPKQMIEVKGLMGDTSDNIPGVPGIGEKTALSLIKQYGTIDGLYKALEEEKDDLKGKTREKIVEGKNLAELSRTLGTINLEVPIEKDIEELNLKEWNYKEVLEMFNVLRFNRYIERFNLREKAIGNISSQEEKSVADNVKEYEIIKIETKEDLSKLLEIIKNKKEIRFFTKYTENDMSRINKKGKSFCICTYAESKEVKHIVYEVTLNENIGILDFKDIFENREILKVSSDLKILYIVLKEADINPENLMFDTRIAGYLLNSVSNLYKVEDLGITYLDKNIENYAKKEEQKQKQMTLFGEEDEVKEENNEYEAACSYLVYLLKDKLEEELRKHEMYELFLNVEMPVMEVLGDMQYQGMYVEKEELKAFGGELRKGLDFLTKDIYDLAGCEFNINSPKQLRRSAI